MIRFSSSVADVGMMFRKQIMNKINWRIKLIHEARGQDLLFIQKSKKG